MGSDVGFLCWFFPSTTDGVRLDYVVTPFGLKPHVLAPYCPSSQTMGIKGLWMVSFAFLHAAVFLELTHSLPSFSIQLQSPQHCTVWPLMGSWPIGVV